MPRPLENGLTRIKEHTETQPRKATPTIRLWEGAWPKDAVISRFRLKNGTGGGGTHQRTSRVEASRRRM